MFAELITPEKIAILSQIIFIDLVLAGDNAIIIGMVASKFPVEQRKKIIFWGISGAVILRIILTLLTAYLLQITGLRLIGGLLLLYIVYKLYVDVIKGSENIKHNKVIYACQHQSAWDTIIIPYLIGDCVIFHKKSLLFIPLFGWHLYKLGMIVITRNKGSNSLKKIISKAKAAVYEKRPILIFLTVQELYLIQKIKFNLE